jgi:hypothetical protein
MASRFPSALINRTEQGKSAVPIPTEEEEEGGNRSCSRTKVDPFLNLIRLSFRTIQAGMAESKESMGMMEGNTISDEAESNRIRPSMTFSRPNPAEYSLLRALR